MIEWKKSLPLNLSLIILTRTLCLIIYIYKVNLLYTISLAKFFFVSRNYINDSWAVRMKRNKNIFKAKMLWEVKTKPKYVLDDGFVMVKLKY